MAKIGIGNWAGKISLRMARGEVRFTISEGDNGEYKIDVTLPGALKTAKINFMNIKEEDDAYVNGTVESIVFKGVHYEIIVKGDTGIEWMIQDVDPVEVGKRVGLTVDPDDIQIMRKSRFSPAPGSYGVRGVKDDDITEEKA